MEKNLGHATAYGYAKSKGYSGTEDEFAQLMADYASVGQSAAQSAEQAAASATSASGSAATASQAAQTATEKASEAVTAAGTATTKASEASQSASTASAAATSASTSAQTATTAASTATTKASEAAVSANTATTAKTDAETARDAAAQSASEAAESARTLIIDATLTQSGQAADAKVVGDKLLPLHGTRNILDVTYEARTTTASFNCPAPETMYPDKKYNIHLACDTELTQDCYIYFRNAQSGNLNVLGIFPAGETEHDFTGVSPTAECTIIRFARGMVGAVYSVKIDEQTSAIAEMQTNIAKNTTAIANISQKKPITDFGAFSNGYWREESTFANISYRAGCGAPITFDKDVVISSYGEFVICAYVGSTAYTSTSTITVPKNTPLKLYIRRLWEDTSETADIGEFTAGVYVLNISEVSEYSLLENSFAGIEMFRTAGFIGDSYTAKRLGHSWVDIVGNRTGVQATKYAKSGDDAGAWITDSANGLSVVLADTPKDLYWIALGINDGQRVDESAAYLGSSADLSGAYADYPDTFWGNMGHIIEAIQAHAPSAKIVLYKPIYRAVWRTLCGTAADKDGIELVRNAIGEIAEHYSLPVMDALDDIFYHSDWYARHMDYDISAGNHPSLCLYPGIASANMRLFSKCVQDNASYFMGLFYSE